MLTSSTLQSPWTTTLYFSFQTGTDLFFATSWACAGDLMQLLIAKDTLPEPLVRLYAAELVEAIDSCHRMQFMHRDLKPDNILLDQRGHIVLGDLGLSTSLLGEGREGRRRAFSQCGTPDYISPEVLSAHTGTAGYGLEADWWSLGAVLYECLLGFCPFFADTPVATCTRILRWSTELTFPPHRAAHLSPPCLDFIKSLLREASGRLGSGARGAAEIRDHAWFTGMDWAGLRSVDVRTLGGELPMGGQAEAVIERLSTLPRAHADFPATLLLATTHFDDFNKLSPSDPRAAPPHPLFVPPLPLPSSSSGGGGGGGGGATAQINSARSTERERVADFTFQRPLSLSARRMSAREGGGEGGPPGPPPSGGTI